VVRHQDAVLRFLRLTGGDGPDAEDALQETFLTAWRAAGTFRGEAGARAWLLTIARHALSRLRRRRSGEPQALVPLEALGLEAGWGGTTPFQAVEDRVALEAALARLEPEEREVILLRDIEGFSGAEAAQILGLAVPALKSRLHRARLRLMSLLRRAHA
jgi:RNA polymerase sigma-70 factor (ECF subfamily)